MRHPSRSRWVDDPDIQRFNPGFSVAEAARTEFGFLILRGAETVGLVLARDLGDGSAQVDLDYVVPRYQGFTLGEFVYAPVAPSQRSVTAGRSRRPG